MDKGTQFQRDRRTMAEEKGFEPIQFRRGHRTIQPETERLRNRRIHAREDGDPSGNFLRGGKHVRRKSVQRLSAFSARDSGDHFQTLRKSEIDKPSGVHLASAAAMAFSANGPITS